MKALRVLALPCLLVVMSFSVRALNAGAAAEVPKPTEIKTHPETLTGQLGTDTDGRTFLNVHTDDTTAPMRHYILYADGDIARQLAELAKKKSKAEVTGQVTPDNKSMKVTELKEIKPKHGHH